MLAIACVLSAAFEAEAEDTNCITIRVLDAKSGKPVKGVYGFAQTSSHNGGRTIQLEKTNTQGVARLCPKDLGTTSISLHFDEYY